MARSRYTFKQSDATRAARAAQAAGLEVQRIEIDRDGKIVVVTAKLDHAPSESKGSNEWDKI